MNVYAQQIFSQIGKEAGGPSRTAGNFIIVTPEIIQRKVAYAYL
jgi:hypothetical protein